MYMCVLMASLKRESDMKANEIKVGMKVTTSGFAGTVTEVCEWSRTEHGVMVVVRLANGTTCVDCCSVLPA